ncbi:MAG: hypothetical protein IKT23_05525, partial [Clostridia bacterium]|nr:hypothetical protein [Clostridia bacterium]
GKKIVADFYRLLGMSEEAISAELDQYTLESLSVLEGEEQEFHATQGGYGYYCVVTDSVKQTATSDIAKTKSTISIWTNPSNANLMGKDSVTLACTATGGSGEYGFSWYKVSEDDEDIWEGFGTTDDEGFNAGKHNEIEIDECGEYYCEAEDLVTHHTATSRVATVYAAPQLRIYVSETTLTRDPGAEVSLSAAIRGGVPPYDIHWECYGDEDPEYEIMSDEETTSTVAITHKAGMYTVYAEDEVGNYTWQTISRYDPDLTIAQQPVGGTMYSNDHEDISIAIADGEAPYHYTLYHNNKVYKEDTIDDAKATFEVEDPGVYYFRVEDSTSRGCTSATATFELPNIKVTILTPSAEIKRWGDPAYLEIAAEGGTEPYYYMWIRIGEDESWHHDANFNSSHYVAYEDGEYFCIVVDAENDSAYSDVMTVTYTGGEPVIIEQPQSHTSAERFPDGAFDVSLHCRATTPSGDYAGIKYVWEIYLPNIGWAQTTTTGEWFYPVEPGLYRCRVINTATGEYVYSKVATVSEKLSLTVEPTGKGGLYSELGEYRYIISGGVAPYNLEITLVSKYPSPQEDGYVEMIDFEAPYIGYCGIPQFPAKGVIDLEIFRDFWYWNPYEGQTKYKWYYASYYMVLTDAAGSSVTSDLIDVIKDYRTGPD